MDAVIKIKMQIKQVPPEDLMIKNNIAIKFKYLQVGHTFMEGDSVHICIEKALKMQDMNIPEDYISVIRNARVKPFPYQVKLNSLLPHTFFKD